MAEVKQLLESTAISQFEQPKKKRRRRRKKVCAYAEKDCTIEELHLILTELDGNRVIRRSNDGRRIRTQTNLESPLSKKNSKKDRKVKQLLLTTYLNKSSDYIRDKRQAEANTKVLPIEQMLALIEVIA